MLLKTLAGGGLGRHGDSWEAVLEGGAGGLNQVISPLDRWGQLWSRPNGSAEWPRRVMEARESSEGPLQLWWHTPRAPSGGVVGHDLAAPPPGRGDHAWPTLGSTHTPLVFPRACRHGSAAVVASSALTHLSVCPPIIHCPVHPPESLWTAWSSGKGRPAQRAALAARPCVGCGYPWSSPGLPEPRLTVPGPVPRTQGQPLPAGHSQPSTGGRTGHPPVHCQRDTRGHGNRRALRPLGGPGVGERRKDFWRMLGASQPGGEGASGLLRTLASRGRRAPAAVRARGGGGWGGGPGFLTHAGWLAPTQSQPCGPGALSTRVPALGWSARAALRTGAPQSTGPARTSVSAGWRVGSPNRTVDCAVCPLLSLAVGRTQ